MKCYIINLDRAADRLAHVSAQLAGLGLDVERVPAIDGDLLAADEIAHWQARSTIWAPLTTGEIACFLSHRKVWSLIAAQGEPWAFVGEDDIHVAGNFGSFIQTTSWLPEGADIVKAETMRARVEMSPEVTGEAFGHKLRRLKSAHLGSAGYFVSRTAAARLLALTAEHCEPVDRTLFSPEAGIAPQLSIHQLDPALCIQDFHLARRAKGAGFPSHIPVNRNVKPASLAARIAREARRLGRQFVSLLRRLRIRLAGQSVFKRIKLAGK